MVSLMGWVSGSLEWFPVTGILGVEKRRYRLRNGEVRERRGYRVRIPKRVVEEELDMPDGGTVLLLVARPKWYHLLNYREEPLRKRFEEISDPFVKAEICLIGNGPRDVCANYRVVPVVASDEEFKLLDIEPGRPVTLEELKEKLKEAG